MFGFGGQGSSRGQMHRLASFDCNQTKGVCCSVTPNTEDSPLAAASVTVGIPSEHLPTKPGGVAVMVQLGSNKAVVRKTRAFQGGPVASSIWLGVLYIRQRTYAPSVWPHQSFGGKQPQSAVMDYELPQPIVDVCRRVLRVRHAVPSSLFRIGAELRVHKLARAAFARSRLALSFGRRSVSRHQGPGSVIL